VQDAYEQALRKMPRYDPRHRLEHFELATDDQIKRARDLGVVASVQPSFELYWGGPSGMYASRLGERWRKTNRLRTMLDAGLCLAGGSDSNVTPAQPLLGMHAAVNHPNEDERISPEQALRLMTIDAAHAAFNERRQGSIAAGKQADFTVLDRDPLAVPRDEIRDVRVLETWRLGRRTFSA
jgi:predicted amidohydrolase YtcJ